MELGFLAILLKNFCSKCLVRSNTDEVKS